MYKDNTILAIIPARGGSKGIPRKNIYNLAGKPLIAWTIEAAMASQFIDRLILSSDDEEIIAVAQSYGCEVPFKRPGELARDETPGIAPVLHAINNIGQPYGYIVLLQPTSPLRTAEDIDSCIKKCIDSSADSCVSMTRVEDNPYLMYLLNEDEVITPVADSARHQRRQDTPPIFKLNGAVYVASSLFLQQEISFVGTRTVALVMPNERSVDIDSFDDLLLAEKILQSHVKGS
ncbi:MAG: cytidylyltransferase domain-containing protein [Methylocystaceae bacterium]